MSSNKHLQAAGYSIASNIAVQFISRGFTFVLGAITLKYLRSSALLGIINVRLALLYTTLQFLSREPFRRACLGETASSDNRRWAKIVNTIWLGLIMSALLAVPLSYLWRLNAPPVEDLAGTTTGDYNTAIVIICLSVMIEMLAEPCYIYAQAKAITDHNPKVEVVSVTIKSLMTAAVTVIESHNYRAGQSSHILSKIAGCQLSASIILVIFSYARLCHKLRLPVLKFLPSIQSAASVNKSSTAQQDEESGPVGRLLDVTSLKLSVSFVSQTFLKQMLTEGERYIMTFFNVISLSEQGIYDVVNNLGSLAARLLFKPIEDSGYTLFSQTVSRTELLDIRRFYRVQENLMYLIRSMLLIGLMIPIFGYNFVPLIVLYGGDKLDNPVAFYLMRWQLMCTPLLAVNGITECFTFAIMDSKGIRRYNYFMLLFSAIYLVSIYTTQTSLGSACFIFANCMIMISRITYSYTLIKSFFYKHGYELGLVEALPTLTTLISLTGVFIFLSVSQHYLLDMSQPWSIAFGIILGGWCLLYIIHVVIRDEEDLTGFAARLFKIKTM